MKKHPNRDIIKVRKEIAEDILKEQIEANRKRAFVSYAWGVWVTSLARLELERGIQLAGDGFIYADTDSVKYTGEIDFSEYNREKIENSTVNGAFATDKKGITHYMGVFEPDGCYKQFVTMGAKKYAYVDEDDKLHITIAGVGKKKGAVEMEDIKNFVEGFTFTDAGGLEAVYNDHPKVKEYIIDGHKINITSNVVLRESTYRLGITQDYYNILKLSKIKLAKLIETL